MLELEKLHAFVLGGILAQDSANYTIRRHTAGEGHTKAPIPVANAIRRRTINGTVKTAKPVILEALKAGPRKIKHLLPQLPGSYGTAYEALKALEAEKLVRRINNPERTGGHPGYLYELTELTPAGRMKTRGA